MKKRELMMESINNALSINESLSRVYSKVIKHDSGTISAFRSKKDCGQGQPYTKAENMKRSTELKSKLLALGYEVTPLKGAYIEGYGSDNPIEVTEVSFLAVDAKDTGKLKYDLIKLGSFFEQDSITFSKARGSLEKLPRSLRKDIDRSSGDYYLISTNTCPNGYPGRGTIGVQEKLGKPMFGKSGEFHSKIKGRPFIFTECKGDLVKLTDHSINEIQSIVYIAKSVILD